MRVILLKEMNYFVFDFKTKSFYCNLMKRIRLLPLTIFLYLFLILISIHLFAQPNINIDAIYKNNIRSVRFNMSGKQLSMPVYNLNSGDLMDLSFDDMDGDVKNYYYSYQLCDYDWQPVDMNPFEYTKGFSQQQITSYQYSSLSYVHYTHYNITLPDPSSLPTLSGNYILKVFLNGDTTQLVFTRRLLVLDTKATVAAQVIQPFTLNRAKTQQRIKFAVNINGLDMFNAGQQVKVRVLQNNRWDNSQGTLQPVFIRGSILDYDAEDNFVFPGSNEWRWVDLRTFRLQTDRVQKLNNSKDLTEIYVKPDIDRSSQQYFFYTDLNGQYTITNTDNVDPNYQADYAKVHFSFLPPNQTAYTNKDLYLIGQFTDYILSDATKLQFNPVKNDYETTALLKQGYYDYGYLLVDKNDPAQRTELDGNHFDTENSYTILVYYKSFSDRNDRLIAISRIDSRTDKPGYSF